MCWRAALRCAVCALQRNEDTKRLEEEIEELEKKIKPLLNNPNFIKGDDDKGDKDNEGVNRWGVYNAYR